MFKQLKISKQDRAGARAWTRVVARAKGES